MFRGTIFLATPLFLTSLGLAQTVLSDTEFAASSWTHSILSSYPAVQLNPMSQELAGGNPGAWQRGSHDLSGPDSFIYDGHLFATPYDPSVQGGIDSIGFSCDFISPAGNPTVATGLLIAQAGHNYTWFVPSGLLPSWTAIGSPSISETFPGTWQEISNAGPIAGHPDFSPAGAPMRFGYYTYNTIPGPPSPPTNLHVVWGIDNFTITIRTHSPCAANCDGSTTPPILNVNDFYCFLNRFAYGDWYANCDGSTVAPVLNVNDFLCFLNRFATGCP